MRGAHTHRKALDVDVVFCLDDGVAAEQAEGWMRQFRHARKKRRSRTSVFPQVNSPDQIGRSPKKVTQFTVRLGKLRKKRLLPIQVLKL